MSLIPRPDRLLALAALVVALIGFGWIKGADQCSQVGRRRSAADLARRQPPRASGAGHHQGLTEYVDRIRIVRKKGDTTIKEVPV
jgi:hypothetical protein